MTKITCVLPTARDDFPFVGGDSNKAMEIHVFQPTFDSLEKQTFKDFELILVDALKNREEVWDNPSFPIRRVYPHRSFWLDRGMWAVAAGYNTGIIEAKGELLVFLNDCCEFDSEFLQRYWYWYKRGYWASALTLYNQNGEPLYNEAGRVRDSRWRFLEERGAEACLLPGSCFYGYSSCTLEAALEVNGFDELFDGCKSEEDPDFGVRLELLYGKKVVVDANLTVTENSHFECSKDVIWYRGKPPKCNDAILRLNLGNKRAVANKHVLTDGEIRLIKEISRANPCSHVGGDDYDLEGEVFKVWAENPPLFDLREKRRLRWLKSA